MTRTLCRVSVALSVCLLASGAWAGGMWRAWSDQTQLPTLAEHRTELASTRPQACMPAVRDPRTPGLAPGGGMDLDQVIRQLEETLSRMKPGDPGRDALQQSLASFRELRARQGSGGPPLPVGTARGAMTLRTALTRAEHVLGPDARKAPGGAGGADIAAALAAGRPRAALALLLAAQRAAPKNPWILVNLAGVLSLTGLPREAIAVLDAADQLGGALPAPAGVPGRAVALSNRGHAFLGLGRWKEAETPLRAALKLAPDFSEARANLSQALLCQGNLDGAVRELRLAMRRTLDAQASPAFPVRESVPNRHGAGLMSAALAPTRRPASDLFDLSRGEAYHLPQLKLPSTREEGAALYEQYVALERAGSAEVNALLDRVGDARLKATPDAGERRWAALVYAATANAHFEPQIWPVYKAAYDAHYAYTEAYPRFARQLNEAVSRIDAPSCAAHVAQLDQAVGTFFSQLRPFVTGQAQAMARYASVMVRHQTALAANLTDPNDRAASRMFAEAGAKGIYYGMVVGAAREMASVAHDHAITCGTVAGPRASLDAPDLPELAGDPCGGVPTGSKLKSKVPSNAFNVNGYGLSFGLSCEKIDIELSASVIIGLYAAASVDWKGTGTVFFGIKADAKVPKGLSLGGIHKSGASAKESVYIKFSKDGIQDAGLRMEGKVSVGIGTDAAAYVWDVKTKQWEAKFEQEFGVAAAVAYWTGR
ncbi:tetratricopeptide repeat protein [Deinococcus sonorensis]|uniref:Tetratricopeptide repeat protein n=2 Tax=Deinococcus sonorensis TaxID=309891 RepID=A0AAU7U5B1_9DEIO